MLARPILVTWAIAATILILVALPAIAVLKLPDPDDMMRLMEVRDWLAGQSWWDVAQHKLNRGNFPMHWSRLVDLPLAATLLALRPLLSDPLAIRGTLVIVPLLTLLAAMAAAAMVTRRAADGATARLAMILLPLSAPILYQIRPLRIDHHGWQIVLTLAATALLLAPPTARRGALAGLSLAALLTISLEGLPIVTMIVVVAGAAWAFQPDRRAFLLALIWSLFVGALTLHAVTRGPALWLPVCDAIAPAWLAMLGAAAIGVTAAVGTTRFGPLARLAALGIAGVATATTLFLTDPACLKGPFATLPPIVYDFWYLNVPEGRPIWEQTHYWAAMSIGLPLAGLYGTIRALRLSTGAARTRWLLLLALLAAATVLSLLVNRASATANALALPGAAALLLAMLTRARAIRSPTKRLFATAGALLVASPGQAAGIALVAGGALSSSAYHPTAPASNRPSCDAFADIRAIDRLPAGLVYAPIDVTPEIIAMTRHRAIAGGYHRGAIPLANVLTTFTGSPLSARRMILASGADYVAFCPGLAEGAIYHRLAPNGFWARLERGERFDWLQPIDLQSPALAWRVVRPLPSAPARP
ncbi:hypothetical protein M0208_13220 [Sphingomonas sp. SUN019]|uniref:hypothetical protein n=1 Tax=Sphingomonas sp. SUN019 TaxID=2937788 RepID=UPI002164929A|nr:hypothetical protein [Sphingomonas sp. SUN019]UVO51417.1 hypothetical protein M0208_13220 [Sphingomonas sp. SUN019]